MTITPAQIDLVQESAAAVDHVLEPFAAAFYDRLFREHPAVRPMFPTDPEVQATKLAAELRRQAKLYFAAQTLLGAEGKVPVRALHKMQEKGGGRLRAADLRAAWPNALSGL